MRLNTLTSFIGFVILIAGTYCPILRPFHLFNWDVYSANKPFGVVILLVAVVGIIGAVFSQPKLVKLIAWLSFGLIILLYAGAQLKVHTSFSFIPFRSIDNLLTRQIKFKWGWYLLFVGPLLALIGTAFGKRPSFVTNSDELVKQNQHN